MTSRRRFNFLLGLPLLAACVTRRGLDGQEEHGFDPKYLAKTSVDRIFDASRAEVVDSVFLLAEKLYRRNPREWRKSGLNGHDEAIRILRRYRETAPAELTGQQEGAAILRAFLPDYAGDRVAAFVYGLLTMIDAAYEHKDEFFVMDSLNGQKLYNCARNVEIAAWKLASALDESGMPLLLSNEMNEGVQNLSFERGFGRIIGQLDFIAVIVADRSGRAISNVAHSLATAVFLPVGMLK
jgi:hypothetical protein